MNRLAAWLSYSILVSLVFSFGSEASAADTCAEFPTDTASGRCFITDQMPWVPFGGGWESRIKLSNIHTLESLQSGQGKECTLQVGFSLLPLMPEPDMICCRLQGAYVFDNRFYLGKTDKPELLFAAGYWLNPGESVEARAVYPDGEDVLTPGSALVNYQSLGDPACLRGLVPAQVQFLLKGADGALSWNATEIQGASAHAWSVPISATANMAADPVGMQDPSIAIANPSETTSVVVRISIVDQYANSVVATGGGGVGDITLLPRESRGIVLRDLLGQAMFPGGNDLTGTMYVSVTGAVDDVVKLCVLQRVGNGMGSLNPTPLQ